MVRICILMITLSGVCATYAAGIKYWVEPCARPAEMGCKSTDPDLAQWAMEAWQEASDGKLRVQRTTDKNQAIIKIYWVVVRAPGYMAKRAAAMSMSGPIRVKDSHAKPSST